MRNQLLRLDEEKVQRARQLAQTIAFEVQEEISRHTTVSVERTVARLFGIDGTNQADVPLANVVVDQVQRAGYLDRGIAFWLANAVVALDQTPQEIAEAVAQDLSLCDLPAQDPSAISRVMDFYTDQALGTIKGQRRRRE